MRSVTFAGAALTNSAGMTDNASRAPRTAAGIRFSVFVAASRVGSAARVLGVLLTHPWPSSLFPLRVPLPGQPLGLGQLIQGHEFLQMVLEFSSAVITLACCQGLPPIGLHRIFRDTSALGRHDPQIHLGLCMALFCQWPKFL